jgi:hypothetical protein
METQRNLNGSAAHNRFAFLIVSNIFALNHMAESVARTFFLQIPESADKVSYILAFSQPLLKHSNPAAVAATLNQ